MGAEGIELSPPVPVASQPQLQFIFSFFEQLDAKPLCALELYHECVPAGTFDSKSYYMVRQNKTVVVAKFSCMHRPDIG